MKLTVSKKAEALKDSGDGGFINKSGVYDVTINYVQVAETKNNALQLNFNVTHKGAEQTIFGPYLTSKKGEINEITQNLINKLCIIAGFEDGQEIETEAAEFPVGKNKVMTEMDIIPELSGLDVKMRIQMEYSKWDGKIQERKAIKAFYREDGATAAEAEAGENIGKRLALDVEKYASNVTYKDGLTEEDVAEWIKDRSKGGSDNKSSASSATPKTTAKRPLFNKPQ